MKQTVEIDVPDGAIVDLEHSELAYKYLPSTWEEFCKYVHLQGPGFYIGANSRMISDPIDRGPRDPELDKNRLSSKDDARAHLALMQLHALRDCYRQGWAPNWDTNEEAKYNITYYGNDASIQCSHYARAFLSFQSRSIANNFLNNFKDLIALAKDLI